MPTNRGSASAFAVPSWVVWLGLPLLVALVYWPGLDGGFVFDDYPNIVSNPALQLSSWHAKELLAAAFSSPASDLQRPISVLSFAFNILTTGMDPRAMKITNIAVHALNSLLVFLLVRRLLRMPVVAVGGLADRSQQLAAFVAACWAVNPINLTAVLYVVQRMESLSHTFVFLGLWLYLEGRSRQIEGRIGGWSRLLMALVGATALGIMAKESAALLPLYALAVELCVLRFQTAAPRQKVHLCVAYAVFLLLPALGALGWLLPRALEPGAFGGREFSMVERLLTEPRVVLDYLRWTMFPSLGQLGLYHDDYTVSRSLVDPPSTIGAIAALIALTCMAWIARRRHPLAAMGMLWFLAAQALTATFLPLELVFEHRNYFASLGVCLAIAGLLLVSPVEARWRRLGHPIALAFLAYCALLTTLRSNEWSSPLRFSATEAAKHRTSPRAQYEFGRQLVIASSYRQDSPFAAEAYTVLERASLLPGSGILPEQGLIMLASRTGKNVREAWWDRMNEKLATRPIGPQELAAIGALTHCAILRQCDLDQDRMLELFGSALRGGENPEVLNIYGDYVLNALGDARLALELWAQASQLRPQEVQYHANRTKLLIALGRFQEARMEIESIRGMGRLGQHKAVADALTRRLDEAERAGPSLLPPAPEPVIRFPDE